jgi:hypothetical protein
VVRGEEELDELEDDSPLMLDQWDEQNRVSKRPHQRICSLGTLGDDNGALVFVSKHNRSLAKIDAELPEAMKGPHLYHGWMADLPMIDFRHIVDEMRTQFDEQHRTGIDGVRISCLGDIHISAHPKFEPWPFEDHYFVPTQPLLNIPIAGTLGFSLVIHCLEPGLSWRGWHLKSNSPDNGFTEEHNNSLLLNPPSTILQGNFGYTNGSFNAISVVSCIKSNTISI